MSSAPLIKNGISYITAKAAAPRAAISADYITKLCRKGEVNAVLVGTTWYVDEASLAQFVARKEAAKKAQAELNAQQLRDAARRAQVTQPQQPAVRHHRPERTNPAYAFGVATTVLLVAMSVGTFALSTPTQQSQLLAAAAATLPAPIQQSLDRVATSVFDFFCPFFSTCDAEFGFASAPTATTTRTLASQRPANSATTSRIVDESGSLPATAQQRPQQQPNIIERITERVQTGISEQLLDARLAALETYLVGRIDLLAYQGDRQAESLADSFADGIGGGGFDDIDITDSTFTGGSISGAAISGGSISGASLSGITFSGAQSFVALTVSDATSTNATSTNLYVSSSFGFGADTGFLRNDAGTVSTLAHGSNGQVLKIVGGIPTWSADLTGGGGGGSSLFASTSDNLAIYPAEPSHVVIIGDSATTTSSNILEVSGNSLFRGTATSYGLLTAPRFTATSSIASSFPYASTTALSATTLCLSADCRSAWPTDTSFSTTSADYWKSVSNLFSTTSADFWETQQALRGVGFSTTSANYWQTTRDFFSTSSALFFASAGLAFSTTSNDYWQSQRNFFSTTSTEYWRSVVDLFSTSSANYFLSTNQGLAFSTTSADAWKDARNFFASSSADYFIHSSSTIPKLYTANAFSALQSFQNASTTSFSATYASSTQGVFGSLSVGTFTGFLKATAGAIATAAIDLASDVTGILGVARGGTGWAAVEAGSILYGNGSSALATTTAGTSGQVLALVGNVPTWVATSTLATISGTLEVSKGGTAATSFSYGLVLSPGGTAALTNIATSSLGLLTTHVVEGSNLYYQDARVQTYLGTIDKGFFFATTSADYWQTERNFFSTTSADGWKLTRDFFSTTSASYFVSVNQGSLFSTTSAIYFAHSSTTIPKTYTANTFSGLQIFANASTTQLTTTGATYLATLGGNVGIGTSTPARNLDVFGNGAVIRVTAGSNGFPSLQLGRASTDATIGVAGSAGNWVSDSAAGDLVFRTEINTQKMLFRAGTNITTLSISSDKIGIGTTTPQWLLNPTSATAPQLSLSAGAGVAQWAFRNAGGDLFLATTTAAGTATTSTSALTISGTGFGTTTLTGLTITGFATSTSNVGFNLSAGCYAINNTCISAESSSFSYLFPAGATTSPLMLLASTTIGNGTQSGGLTVSGDATTTGNGYFGGNVGIGTTNPTGLLDIANSLTLTSMSDFWTNYSGTEGSYVLGSNADAREMFFGIRNDSATSSGIYVRDTNSSSDDYLALFSSKAERLRIDSAGNVGIGTTAPDDMLHIVSSSTTAPVTLKVQNTGGGGVDAELLLSTSGTLTNTSVGGSLLADRTDTGGSGTTDLAFRTSLATSLTERMRITGAGNVGIGTTTPTGTLSVTSGTAGSVTNALLLSSPRTFLSGDTGGVRIAGLASNGNMGSHDFGAIVMRAGYIGNGGASVMDFYVGGSSSAGTSGRFLTATTTSGSSGATEISLRTADLDRLSISTSGNVGIGSTTTWAKLSINSTAGMPQFVIGSSTTQFIVDQNGNVAVGIAAPTSALHVAQGKSGRFELGSGQKLSLGGQGTFEIDAVGTAGGRFMITESGNAGIGTTSPLAKLSINSTAGMPQLVIGSSTTQFIVDASGNVGIGEAFPDATLEIAGTSQTAASFDTTGSKAGILEIQGGTAGVGSGGGILFGAFGDTFAAIRGHISDASGNGVGNLLLSTRNSTGDTTLSERMRITSAGNVGIASTSPWKTLSVVGTAAINGLTSSATGNYVCINTTTWELTRGNGSACTTSSERFKEDIVALGHGLEDVLTMRAVSFRYKPEMHMGDATRVGFIAEEMQQLVPEVVALDEQGQPSGIDYPSLTAVLANAIKEIASITSQFKQNLIAFLADTQNGITDLFTKNLYAENVTAHRAQFEELCLGSVCVTEAQFMAVFGGQTVAQQNQTAAASLPVSGGSSASLTGASDPQDPSATPASTTPESTQIAGSSATSSPSQPPHEDESATQIAQPPPANWTPPDADNGAAPQAANDNAPAPDAEAI